MAVSAAALATLPVPAAAQGLVVEPSVTVQQTFTDNAGTTDNDRHSDAITRISPGVRLSGRSGRTVGSLDYRLDAVAYARDGDRSELRNNLAADASTELVDNHVFLDASASVSQQSISAFGQRSAGIGLTNDNTSEVSSITVSPRARTRLAGVIDLNALASWTKTSSGDSRVGDATDWNARLSAGARHGIFGWEAAATRQSSDYDDGSRLLTDSGIGTLSIAPTSRLTLFARGGRERVDYGTASAARSMTTSGGGLQWQPTPRTQISAQVDDRYYGRSHGFTFSHRLRHSVLSYTDSRGVSGEDTQALGPFRQAYMRVYSACMAAVNNAGYCTQVTRATFGLDPTQSLGFLNSAPSLQRSQALALAVTGPRNSFALAATRTLNERLDQFEYTGGDLQQVPRVREQGISFSISHRLTPIASLWSSLSLLKTLDEPDSEFSGNDQRRIEIGVSNELGPRTSGSLSLRHVRFDSDASPYRESALVGSLNHRF